jgi:hypothetical protein
MAAYLKLPLSNQQNYVEIKLLHSEGSYNTTTTAAEGVANLKLLPVFTKSLISDF